MREIFDEQQPVKVKNLSLDGKTLRFRVVRGDRQADYSGKVADADHINGTVLVPTGDQTQEYMWKAKRRENLPLSK